MRTLAWAIRILLLLSWWLARTSLEALGLAVVVLVMAVGPPTDPPRIDTLVIPDKWAMPAFERAILDVTLRHTRWEIETIYVVSAARAETPNGTKLRFIGILNHWICLDQQKQSVTVAATR